MLKNSLQQFTRYDRFFNLFGALVNLDDLRVAVESLDVIFGDVAVTSVELQRFVGHIDGRLSGVPFGHRDQGGVNLTVVEEISGSQREILRKTIKVLEDGCPSVSAQMIAFFPEDRSVEIDDE